MNLRNWQVFGFSALKPKTKLFFLCFIILVIGGISLLALNRGETATRERTRIENSKQGSPLTGSAVAEIPTFVQEETLVQQGRSSREQAVEQPEPAQEPDELEYFEYSDQCAADIKKSEDDVVDITTFLPEHEAALTNARTKHDQKKTELEGKIADLEKQLETIKGDLSTLVTSGGSELRVLEERVNATHVNLEAAQKKLEELKSGCSLKK